MEEKSKKLKCPNCDKAVLENESRWFAFNIQKGKQKMVFCCSECLSDWMMKKQTTMIISLVLGAILMFLGFTEFGAGAILLFLGPYMLRQVGGKLASIASDGAVGEIISIMIVVMGTMTVIYPLVILIQEIKEYSRIRQVLQQK